MKDEARPMMAEAFGALEAIVKSYYEGTDFGHPQDFLVEWYEGTYGSLGSREPGRFRDM